MLNVTSIYCYAECRYEKGSYVPLSRTVSDLAENSQKKLIKSSLIIELQIWQERFFILNYFYKYLRLFFFKMLLEY
jgi:hypothetical protein